MFTNAEIISVYTRAQALEDGALVDAGPIAKEVGFRWPVAMTAAVYADCVAWDENDQERTGQCQDQEGRLWDVLWMASLAARRGGATNRVDFTVARISRDASPEDGPEDVRLVLHIGPGDTPEPVMTLMFPGES